MGSETPSPTLPIIDFSKEILEEPGGKSWLSTSKMVCNALEEYGCFVVKYTGVSPQLHHEVLNAMEELFDLPTDTKVKNTSDIPFYGYLGPQPDIPLYESFGIGNSTNPTAIESFSNTMWPSGNDHFREIMYSYTSSVSELEQIVTKMVFGSYGVEKHYPSYVQTRTYLLRLMKYKVPDSHQTNCGAQAHTDKSFITILDQNHVSGLEVQTKAGEWISVQFPPSSFVVMAADAFLAWSNGRTHSATHRVVINGKEPRYSLGLFTYHNGTIRTPEELIDEEHPAQFKPFDHMELLSFYAKNMSHNDCIAKTYCGV